MKARYDAVGIVATAGGLSGIRRVIADLPENFAAPVLCLQPSSVSGAVIEELQSHCRLRVEWARAGESPQPGCVYLSPPGATILLREDRCFSLAPFSTDSESLSPVDIFLGSLARAYGDRAMAVFVSGWGTDGLRGGIQLRNVRGRILVRDQTDAPYLSPIDSLISAGIADAQVPLDELGLALKIALHAPAAVGPTQLREAVDPLLARAMALQNSHAGAVHLRDPGAPTMQMLVHRNCAHEIVSRFRIIDPDGGAICAQILSGGRRVVVEDVANEAQYADYREIARLAGVGAAHIIPMPAQGGNIVGLMSTLFPQPRALGADEASRLDALARDAAQALQAFL